LFNECISNFKEEQQMEDQKLFKREVLWQQVESLARNNPDWSKVAGQFSNMNLTAKRDVEYTIKRDDEFSQLPDNDLSYERLVQESGEIRNIRNKDKPLMRRKSDLVEDTGTVRALMEHKRADEYLTTPPNVNQF